MHPFCAIFNGSCEIFFMGLIMPEIPETDPVSTSTPTGNPPTGTSSPPPKSTKPDEPALEEPSLLQKGAQALAKGAKKNISDAVDDVDKEITEEDTTNMKIKMIHLQQKLQFIIYLPFCSWCSRVKILY